MTDTLKSEPPAETTPASPPPPERSLYDRLGGYDALAAATNDLMARLFGDPQLGVYWKGKGDDGKKRDIQLIITYMVAASGGPAHYGGREMRLTHTGLGITEGEWQTFMHHAEATLERFAVPERETQEVLDFFSSLKGDVVEQTPAVEGR
jgi:hemoglobin